MAGPTEPVPLGVSVRNGSDGAKSLARMATWFVGLVAAALVSISVAGYFYHRQQLTAIAAEHVRLVVTGPASLQPGMPAEYVVGTTAINGQPLPVQVETALLAPDGTRLMAHSETTNERGRLQVAVPGDLSLPSRATLRVIASYREKREAAEIPLTVGPPHYSTCLSIDRPLYQPGETLYYRSLTLSGSGAASEQPAEVQFEVLDSSGAAVPHSRQDGVTDRGVANGAFPIPKALPAGQYTLIVRSPARMFPEQRRPFSIRAYHLPRWKKELDFAQTSYAAGEKVLALFRAQRADRAPAAGAKLHVVATIDGQTVFEKDAVFEKKTAADDAGTLPIEFDLPPKIDRGEGQLAVTVADGVAMETQTKTIPVLRGAVDLAFFPEGGQLAAGLESRVYFVARDSQGKPVSVSGAILASGREKQHGEKSERDGQTDHEEDVAVLETTYNGMGTFSYIPQAGESYRLKLTSPAGVKCESKLPEISTEGDVVLSTGAGVFAAGVPIEFNLRAAKPGLPLVVAVYCRGLQVGEQPLVTKANRTGANPVAIALDDAVSGVLRLAVYDYRNSPPKLVAERLVYRRASRKLNVQITGQGERRSPGEAVTLSLLITNERDEPVPAALGVSVVDEALLSLSGRRVPSVPTQFLATGEIQRPEDLDNADFYLSEDARDGVPAAVALDLLLGAQARQRSAENPDSASTGDKQQCDRSAPPVASGGPAGPPVMIDNIDRIREDYSRTLAEYHAERIKAISALITIALYGALGLVLLVAMLGLMRIVWGMHLWIPAVGSATCCLLIGAILTDPSRQPPEPDMSVAFQSYPVAEPEEAEPANDKPAAQEPSYDSPLPLGEGQGTRAAEEPKSGKPPAESTTARPMPIQQYAHQHTAPLPAEANDFTETLFWNPLLLTDADGKALIHFDLSNAATTFRVLVDAQGSARTGSGQAQIVSRMADAAEPRKQAGQQ